VSKRIVILLHVLHLLSRWHHRCCCMSRELCSNYLLLLIISV